MAINETVCPNPDCGEIIYAQYLPATRDDPACWAEDPPENCPACDTELDWEDSEPASLEELRYANDPRV